MFREQARKRLTKRAKKGFRGFPVATVAFYGPDNRRASKLAVGIVLAENEEAVELKRWFAEPGDVREDVRIAEEVLAYMDGFGVRSVAMVDRIIGCPPEEGIDYHGPTCPLCSYWAGRDRGSVRARASKYSLCSRTGDDVRSRGFQDGQHRHGAAEELESAAIGGNMLVMAGAE